MQALKTLASKAAGDVRSCINTLQLLSARHGVVTSAHVAAVPVGDKDMTAAPFAMWGKLLSSRPPRPSDMLAHLMSFGEHDLVRCLLRALSSGALRAAATLTFLHLIAYLVWLGI